RVDETRAVLHGGPGLRRSEPRQPRACAREQAIQGAIDRRVAHTRPAMLRSAFGTILRMAFSQALLQTRNTRSWPARASSESGGGSIPTTTSSSSIGIGSV